MMKKALSLILCTVFLTSALYVTSAAGEDGGIAGDINRDTEVNNKDVVSLFRYLNGDDAAVDETACDTNGDGMTDNKDVVVLFRHVTDPSVKIFYGKEAEIETPDNIFKVWDQSVAETFTNVKDTDISLDSGGIHLKYTGTAKVSDPRVTFDISEYARIKNKPALTGKDASYVVIRIKSNTDGDLQLYTKPTGGELKNVSYMPDGEFHNIIVDMTATKLIKEEVLTTVRIDWGSNKTKTGSEATITEIGFFDTLEGALDYAAVIAGTDSGIVRDGTPKKYVTMSFDDATQQDLRVIEILKKYGVNKATFFINTGLCGADWSSFVGVSHVRFTMDELKTGIYKGYDVESHTLNHLSMKSFDNDPASVKKEVMTDAINIFNLTGVYPAGMAWPGGDGDQTATTRKLVYENTNIRFSRGTTFQNGLKNRFKLPTEFLLWEPTNTMSNSTVTTLFQKFLEKECTEDMLFYGFSHAYEFDAHGTWNVFEQFIQMVAEAAEKGEIVLVTNAEFYQLFKDEIPAYIPAE